MKLTKAVLTAKISERTGLTSYKSRKALKETLWLICRALGDGKQVEMGERLGKLKVVERKYFVVFNKRSLLAAKRDGASTPKLYPAVRWFTFKNRVPA